MRWRSISWTACKGDYRICLGTINLALLCIALVQVAMIGSILLIGTITIPQAAQRYLENRFEEEGVHVSWGRALFHLTGKFIFEDFTLLDRTRENIIFEAKHIRADLDTSLLFWRSPLQLESFFLREGALYLPPELSEGSDKPTLWIDELKIDQDWNSITIEEAHLKLLDARIFAHGKVTLSGYGFDNQNSQDSFNLSTLWRRSSAKLVPLIEYADLAGKSLIDLSFESSEASAWSALAEACIPRLKITSPAKIEAEHIHARAALSFTDDHLVVTEPSLSTDWISVERDGTRLTLLNPRVAAVGENTFLDGGVTCPSSFHLRGHLGVPELGLVNLSLRGEMGSGVPFEPELTLHREAMSLQLRSPSQKPDGSRDIHFDFSGEPDAIFDLPMLVGGGIGRRTDFTERTRIRGTAILNADNSIEKVNFGVDAKQFMVKEAFFDEARTDGFYKDKVLQFGPIRVFDDEGQNGEGYYIHKFDDTGFRIVASGDVKAHLLDSLLPPFYVKLWKDIDPGERPVTADVDVTGKWNDRTGLQAFVDIEANDVGFRTLPVNHASVYIWYAYGFVELIELEALTDGAGPRGDIAFTFARPWSTTGNRTFLDVTTIQPLDTLPIVFGPDVEVLDELMDFKIPPVTQLKGYVNYGEEAAIKQSITLRVYSRSEGTFNNVNFDRIQLNVFQENTLNFISLLEGEIDDGSVRLIGEINPATNGEGWAADLSIQSNDLPLETFKDILIELDPTPSLSLEAEKTRPLTGKVDLTLNISFDGVPWKSLGGHGVLQIKEATLGRIHLFGGLSRVFSSVGLTMTSLVLDRLKTTVELAPREVRMPDLILRGPALRVDSPGKIILPSTFLDFRATAYPLDREQPSLQSLIGSILSPLSFFLEVEVKGTFDNPIWRLTKNPFNLLRAPLTNPLTQADQPTESQQQGQNQAESEVNRSTTTAPSEE